MKYHTPRAINITAITATAIMRTCVSIKSPPKDEITMKLLKVCVEKLAARFVPSREWKNLRESKLSMP
jgi:hypothetical protein